MFVRHDTSSRILASLMLVNALARAMPSREEISRSMKVIWLGHVINGLCRRSLEKEIRRNI